MEIYQEFAKNEKKNVHILRLFSNMFVPILQCNVMYLTILKGKRWLIK